MEDDRRQKMMKRVQDLLARAASSEFEAEADQCRSKANDLMVKWKIEEFELISNGQAVKQEPCVRPVYIGWYDDVQEEDVRSAMWSIWHSAMQYTGVIPAPITSWENGQRVCLIVGLPADIDYLEVLFTNLYLECMMRMSPGVDKNKPMIENLVKLKEVGHKWEYIGQQLIDIGQLDRYDRNVGVRFTKLYSNYCKQHNREQVRTNPVLYKRSFVAGFAQGIYTKIRDMMEANDRKFNEGGMGLVLRDNRIDLRAFFDAQGFQKPSKSLIRRSTMRPQNYDNSAVRRGVQSGLDTGIMKNPGDGVGNRPTRELPS